MIIQICKGANLTETIDNIDQVRRDNKIFEYLPRTTPSVGWIAIPLQDVLNIYILNDQGKTIDRYRPRNTEERQ